MLHDGNCSTWAQRLVVIFSLLPTACASDCNKDDGGAPIEHRDGETVDGQYATSPVSGPFLKFASGSRWELFHDLGAVPRSYGASVAFSECPTAEPCSTGNGDGSGLTLAAGNAVTFDSFSAESVVVRNDTCSDFFLYVWLRVQQQQ